MKLYSIKNKSTGGYIGYTDMPYDYGTGITGYSSVSGTDYVKPYCSYPGKDSPTFWKKPDTIAKHLKHLCGYWKKSDFSWYIFIKFDAKLLSKYEVVVTDVTVDNQVTLPSTSFIDSKALAES